LELSQIPGELLLALFLIFFFGLVGGAIYLTFREAKKRRQSIIDRGLVPQKPPDAAFVAAMQRLKPDMRVENVYRQDRGGYLMYFFELWSSKNRDDSAHSYNTVGLLTPDFRIPRFLLAPNVHMRGLNRLLEWGIKMTMRRYGLQRISFPESQVFDEAYVMLCQDETAVRQFFTLERLNRLATACKNFSVEGQDDLLTFTRADLEVRSRTNADQFDAMITGAAMLYAIFRD
jgi:hypothetical protein